MEKKKTVADITWEGLDKENKWLRTEVEKLKIEIGGLMGERDGLKMVVERLHKEIEEQEAEGKGLFDEIDYWKRECKKLKEEIRFLEECLDNKEKVNKSLREELDKYKKQYEHSMGEDNGKLTKGGYASFNEYGELMEEDTLQELRDLGEI